MDEKQVRAAVGHQVRIEAGIESAEGELTRATPATMNVDAWGSSGGLEIPNGDWALTIDGETREWSSTADLTIRD